MYRNIVALGGFTHNLHDEMTLSLSKRESNENGAGGAKREGGER